MRMMNRRQFLKYAGAGLIAAGAIDRLAWAAGGQQETIPIGVVYPLTGSLARIDRVSQNAASMPNPPKQTAATVFGPSISVTVPRCPLQSS